MASTGPSRRGSTSRQGRACPAISTRSSLGRPAPDSGHGGRASKGGSPCNRQPASHMSRGWSGSWSILGLVLALGTAILVVGSRQTRCRPRSVRRAMATSCTPHATATSTPSTPRRTARPLVTGSAADSQSDLLAGWARFAFVRRDAGSSSTSIVLANADGSGLREITGLPEEVAGMAPVTGRDQARGRRESGLVDRRARHGADAGDADDQFIRRYTTRGSPQWRPNGHELIFLSSSGGHRHPARVLRRPDGRNRPPRDRPTDDPDPAQPALSPDGTKVAYSIQRSDQREIHVVDVETGSTGVSPSMGPSPMSDRNGRRMGRSSSSNGRRSMASSDGRTVSGGPVTRDRADAARQDRRRRCPVLAGRQPNPRLLQRRRTTWVLDPRAVLAPSSTTPPSPRRRGSGLAH